MYNIEEAVIFLKQSGVTFEKIEFIIDRSDDDFLEKYGMPQLNSVFIIEDLLFYDIRKIKFINGHYLNIGNDGLGDICIDISNDKLVSINQFSKQCYINQSLSDFIYCLYLYKKTFIDVSENLNDYEEEQIFYKIESLFDDIDPRILSSENNWWSEVIEPLQYGMI